MRTRFVFILVVVGLLWLLAVSQAQDPQVQTQRVATKTPGSAAALADVPSGQAVVTYEGGQLTIKAQSAPLLEVLQAVCSQVRADLDAPPEAAETVVGVFGPGPAPEVLAAMMSGSQLNVAIAGSTDDPNAVTHILILPKSTDSSAQTTNGPDAPPTQDSVALNQAVEVDSASTASTVESRTSQMKELFAQVQAELSQMGGEGAGYADVAKFINEAEAQIKAAVGDRASDEGSKSQIEQPAAVAQPAGPAPAMRHRRRR